MSSALQILSLWIRKKKRTAREGLPSPNRRSCQTGEPVNRNLCLFCANETHAGDHSFQKLSLTQEIHDKAVKLGEDRILALLAEGDLVAIEAKYPLQCMHNLSEMHPPGCTKTSSPDVPSSPSVQIPRYLIQLTTRWWPIDSSAPLLHPSAQNIRPQLPEWSGHTNLPTAIRWWFFIQSMV